LVDALTHPDVPAVAHPDLAPLGGPAAEDALLEPGEAGLVELEPVFGECDGGLEQRGPRQPAVALPAEMRTRHPAWYRHCSAAVRRRALHAVVVRLGVRRTDLAVDRLRAARARVVSMLTSVVLLGRPVFR